MAKAVPDVPVCDSAEQIGCVVTWNAVGPQAQTWGDPSKNICVNPLTWRTDGAAAEASMNLGGVAYPGTFEGTIADVKGAAAGLIDAKPFLETGVADAQCVDGMLLVQGNPLAALRVTPDGPRQLSRLRLQPVPHEPQKERGDRASRPYLRRMYGRASATTVGVGL